MRLPTTPATTLWRALRDEVRAARPAGRVIVSVDGIDGAGTSTFADGFAEVFAEDGDAVFRASIDDFHRPRAERHRRGGADPEGLYLDSYDYATFRRVLIDPFRDGGRTAAATGFQLAAFDPARDAPVEARWVTGPEDAVLIVDGIFLHRVELRELWDWSLWLDVPWTPVAQRMAQRDRRDPAAPADVRHRGGHELYLRDADPRSAASVIVENVDPLRPRRVR